MFKKYNIFIIGKTYLVLIGNTHLGMPKIGDLVKIIFLENFASLMHEAAILCCLPW